MKRLIFESFYTFYSNQLIISMKQLKKLQITNNQNMRKCRKQGLPEYLNLRIAETRLIKSLSK